MAGSVITNNLYPPVVDSYMPAFINTENLKIVFSYSDYNNSSDIGAVQMWVARQTKTGTSALNKDSYPGGFITFKKISKTNDGKYYVTLKPSDLYYEDDESDETLSGYVPTEFYVVKLRLVDAKCTIPSDEELNESWVVANSNYLSEWSTQCLIKPISRPSLDEFSIISFSSGLYGTIESTISNSTLTLAGKLVFEDDPEESEKLSKFKVTLYKNSDTTAIFTSDWQYTNNKINPNEILYTIPYELETDDETTYNVSITYTTTNGYTGAGTALVKAKATEDKLKAKLYIEQNKENGYMRIGIQSNDYKYYLGGYTIRRTSSKSNFTIWEDIVSGYAGQINETTGKLEPKHMTILDDYYYDFTVEPGVWYQYGIQARDLDLDDLTKINELTRGPLIKSITLYPDVGLSVFPFDTVSLPTDEDKIKSIKIQKYIDSALYEDDESALYNHVLCDFEYSYLSHINYESMNVKGCDRQLKICYDESVDSYSRNVLEEKIDTIGSKYPFIVRGSASGYRTFTLSGLIFSLMDDENLFLTEDELYDDNADMYNEYNVYYNVSNEADFTKERLFREKVIDFLYDEEPKLFRSATEGLILVRLTEISFTPKAEIDRMAYQFSATCVEIGDASSIKGLAEKFTLGENASIIDSNLKNNTSQGFFGQITLSLKDSRLEDSNVTELIKTQFTYDNLLNDKDNIYKNTLKYFSWLKFNFNGTMTDIGGSEDPMGILGYVINIDGSPFYVLDQDGEYDLIQPIESSIDDDGNITYKESTTAISNTINVYNAEAADDATVTITYLANLKTSKRKERYVKYKNSSINFCQYIMDKQLLSIRDELLKKHEISDTNKYFANVGNLKNVLLEDVWNPIWLYTDENSEYIELYPSDSGIIDLTDKDLTIYDIQEPHDDNNKLLYSNSHGILATFSYYYEEGEYAE